jgi:hypothetical protein
MHKLKPLDVIASRIPQAILFYCRLALGLYLSVAAYSQISNVRIVGTTSTQAILAYTAPSDNNCTIEVGETSSLTPRLHDTNPQLFPGAGSDDRAGGLRRGRNRLFLIGRRTAEQGIDGRRYSRAMAAGANYHYSITCDSSVVRGSFRTRDIPTGVTVNDPLPVDPIRRGEYAWPSLDWRGADSNVIDPLTGLRLHRVTGPEDKLELGSSPFRAAISLDGSWQGPESAINANDGGLAASHSGERGGFLMLDAKQGFYQGGTHDNDGNGLVYLSVKLKAWCEHSTCASASAEQRTLDACLTVNGVSCSTDTLSAVLTPCSSQCSHNVVFGDNRPLLASWGTNLDFNITHAQNRTGLVNREGHTVRWVGGHKFSLKWQAGSVIVLNGVPERIAAVNNEEMLTLQGGLPLYQNNVRYEASNFGVLLRRKVAGMSRFRIEASSFEYGVSPGISWDSSGDGENHTNCSEKLVPGPQGELGYHCTIANGLYWMGSQSGRVSRLGVAYPPDNAATPNGWRAKWCDGAFWDADDPNSFYCKATDTSSPSQTIVLRATYRGDNRDIGSSSLYDRFVACNASQSNQPCFSLVNITPSSTRGTIESQLRTFHPEAASFVVRNMGLIGRQGRYLIMMARREDANDVMGFMIVLDPLKGKIVAAAPSWKSWPTRWSGLHGGAVIGSPDWVFVPSTSFRGPATGTDWFAGNGPYRSKILSGALDNIGRPCPIRPANSRIPISEWPSGNNCLTVVVDGEPCDSSPAGYSSGEVQLVAGNPVITGINTGWSPDRGGLTMVVNGRLYAYTYVNSTSARLSPTPTESFRGAYFLSVEPINSSKCGSPMQAYLQDAEPGDVFCGNSNAFANECGLYSQFEWFRLLVKSGNQWTLQRKVGESGQMRTHPQNTMLIAYPPTCPFGALYPCGTSVAYWNFTRDPLGRNSTLQTVMKNNGDPPTGHGSLKPGLEVFSVSNTNCPTIDRESFSCYGFRRGTFPNLLRTPFSNVSNNPASFGLVGIGSPNTVDSHPTVPLLPELADPASKTWFLDARPMLGENGITGSQQNPGVRLDGDLYRFTSSQIARLRRKSRPTMAFCGSNPLFDVSGPGSAIDGSESSRFTFCVAERNGECRWNSQRGDVYVSCPQISRPYCHYPGVGSAGSDVRDICLGDNGAYTQAITQIGVGAPNQSGANGRVLTYALSRYRFTDVFWNAKLTPDGRWMLLRVPWLDGKKSEVLSARVPPMPASPDDTSEMRLSVSPPLSVSGVSAAIEFGYTPEFFCTSRREGCIRGSHTGRDFDFTSASWRPKPCNGACEITIPVVPNRVIYWRALYFNSAGKQVGVSDSTIGVTSAPQ